MATFVSPGVYVVENDNSNYVPSLNPSVVGIVGFASKGPTNKATLITDQDNLVRTFGEPDEDIPGQGLEGSLEILEATNSLYFVRAVSGGAEASGALGFASCPGLLFSGHTAGVSGPGVDQGVKVTVSGYDYANKLVLSKRTYTVASGYDTVFDAVKATFSSTLDNHIWTVESLDSGKQALLGLNYPGKKARLDVSCGFHLGDKGGESLWASGGESEARYYQPAQYVSTLSANGDPKEITTNTTGIQSASGISLDTENLIYKAESLYAGAGYNYVTKSNGAVRGLSVTVSDLKGERSQVIVNDQGVQEEIFTVTTASGEYNVHDVINTGNTNETSEYIKASVQEDGTALSLTDISFGSKVKSLGVTGTLSGYIGDTTTITNNVNPRFVKLLPGTYKLANGTNGNPGLSTNQATALIGASNSSGKTGMYALDDDLLGISIAAVPGFTQQSVQNALITLAETTSNFLAVVAPPYAVGTVQDAIDWTNGVGTGDRTAAINSSWAAVYWPWVKVFNSYDGKDRWYDPAVYGIRQMCFTDEVADSWFAPAGFARGRLTKPSEVEVRVGQGDRDAMYSGGNVLNPIVNFPQQGIVVFGQRTAQRSPSALDRVNVRRMMIIIKKLLQNSTRQFAFEPNDPITWEAVSDLTSNLLDPISRRRGITEYQVVCDSSTNTPDRIERGELWCKVFIKPTKAAEVIVFELNLVDQQAAI
jgi:phage tail sheath protein FI